MSFNFEDTPESQYFETIVVATGEFERLKNRQRVISRQTARLKSGYWVFQYEKVSGHGKLLVPDDPNTSLISKLYRKFSTGELQTLSAARDFLTDGGLLNRARRPMVPTVEETKRILTERSTPGSLNIGLGGYLSVLVSMSAW